MKLEALRLGLALKLHSLGGKLHPLLDFRSLGHSITMKDGKLTLHDDTNIGLQLWYIHPFYDRIHDDRTFSQKIRDDYMRNRPITLDELYDAANSPYADLFNNPGVVLPGTGKTIPKVHATVSEEGITRHHPWDGTAVTASGGMVRPAGDDDLPDFIHTNLPDPITTKDHDGRYRFPRIRRGGIKYPGQEGYEEQQEQIARDMREQDEQEARDRGDLSPRKNPRTFEYEKDSGLWVTEYSDGSVTLRYATYFDAGAVQRFHQKYDTTHRDYTYDGSTNTLTIAAPEPLDEGLES